ncbi:serine hydrolase domain-containing protein [Longirhabdus pacifica]|uniref:serine hydrolase domain-containing protein n=1 Tax=Longirhabdus pacifica TaxID=2305227 RepID=UPI00100922BA|nr:serine hydrolase [Longirhabdus pacifica]
MQTWYQRRDGRLYLKLLMCVLFLFIVILAGCNNEDEIETYWPTEEWRTTTPESVGADSNDLADMFELIKKNNLPMDGLIVVKDGYIIAEKYGNNYTIDDFHEVHSITKTVTSAILGTVMRDGIIKSTEEYVFDYLDESPLTSMKEEKSNLTIKHFLTMTSGIDFPEVTMEDFYNSKIWEQFVYDKQPPYYYLNRRLREDAPAWNYSSGDTHIVSTVIQKALGEPIDEYAQKYVFDPIGIQEVKWEKDVSGVSFGGFSMSMIPRDIARMGYLYLQDGVWDGEQIFAEGWVDESTQPYEEVNLLEDGQYGYSIWLKNIAGYDTFMAIGYAQQYMVVVPDLELIVVQTSNNMDLLPLLEKYIIPSIQSDEPLPENETAYERLQQLLNG